MLYVATLLLLPRHYHNVGCFMRKKNKKTQKIPKTLHGADWTDKHYFEQSALGRELASPFPERKVTRCVCVCVCVCVQASSKPEQTSNGQWNCSVPHWPDFQRHFRCNLETECASGEDEENCPYGHCGPGRLSAGKVCPLIICPSVRLSDCLSVRTATAALAVFLLVQSVPGLCVRPSVCLSVQPQRPDLLNGGIVCK